MIIDIAATCAVLFLAAVYVERWWSQAQRALYARQPTALSVVKGVVKTAAVVALALGGIWL